MSRYIDADALINNIPSEEIIAKMFVAHAPTIEPKRGEWIEENGRVICSECRCNALRTMTGCLMDRHLDYNKSNFCPNCGASMKGADDE